jgi:hypothetical protein
LASYIANLTEAVKDLLNSAEVGSGEDLSQEVNAQRVYVPEKEYWTIAEDGELNVHVFARAVDRSRETRASVKSDVEVNVVYFQKIDALVEPETDDPDYGNPILDGLIQLGEEIADLIANADPLTVYGGIPCVGTEQDPLYDFEVLRTHRTFVGLIRANFYRASA